MGHDLAPTVVEFERVLKEELEHVDAARKAVPGRNFDGAPRAGLALSGGGIRSATFNLGILQALAEAGRLSRFDYLSTVSGGGYIGGWLTAWIHRKGLSQVEDDLARGVNGAGPEPHEVRWLRAHSNFLTPRKGALSLDVLWGVMTYLRNLSTNQLMLAALIVSALLLFASANQLLTLLAQRRPVETWYFGAICVLAASPFLAFEIASLRGQRPRQRAAWLVCLARKWRLYWAIPVLIVLGGAAMGYAFAQDGRSVLEREWAPFLRAAVFPAFWLLAAAFVPIFFAPADETAPSSNVRASGSALLQWLIWIALASVVYALVERPFAQLLRARPDPWLTALLGPVLYVAVLQIGTLTLILLAGRLLHPYAHDWLSRMAAMALRVLLAPFVVLASWIVLLPTVDYLAGVRWTLPAAATAWLGSTLLGVLGARSPATGTTRSNVWLERALILTPYIFLLGLLALHVWSMRAFLLWLLGYHPDPPSVQWPPTWTSSFRANLALLERIPDEAWFSATAFVGALAALFAMRVDVNLFSFHAYYRNRITEAYLGASAEKRRANVVTRQSPEDSPALADLRWMDGAVPIRPYPIINTALNLSGRTRMEWQERKAASFVFSPLYCGYELPRPLSLNLDSEECYPDAEETAGGRIIGHRRTEEFLRGKPSRRISHALAVAISGAAASPNMGYHTSTSLAALMTAFNVRLGWWMPNPRYDEPWKRGGPNWSAYWIAKELVANANESDEFVYLSDGGHFENLGVYELLRRRCKLIVASDASADPRFVFDDLAKLVHKARADLQIEIELDTATLRPQVAATGIVGSSAASYVVATIRYPGDEPTGCFVYLKSSLPPRLPADIENYRESKPGFPHQSTTDQWFDESQFEAYRRLGLEIGRTMCLKVPRELQSSFGW